MAEITFGQFNPYQAMRKNKSAITVDTTRVEDGWIVEVKLPKGISGSDKLKMLDWLKGYREQIRSSFPTWDVYFKPGSDKLELVVKPAGNQDDLREVARDKANGLMDYIVGPYVGR